MAKNTDILIIGGSAAGLSAANSAKSWYPDKKVTVVRDVSYTVVPCGIPYIYGYLQQVEKDKIPDEGFLQKGIEIIVGKVEDIDRVKKIAKFADGEQITYEKLVLGIGSKPLLPPIEGVNLKNVFPVKKDPVYLEELNKALEQVKEVVVIGGGFIGVEMAEQIKLKGDYNVTLVEALPCCLQAACEEEAGRRVDEELKKLGINVYTSTLVEAIYGNGIVEEVKLSNGELQKADLVILGIGALPNIDLAEQIGLAFDKANGIIVDEYLRTSDHDIFACGDCCSKYSVINGKPVNIRLASVATAEGMIVGSNLYELRRKTRGVVGAFATSIGSLSVAAAGYTDKMCHDQDINYYTGEITSPDRHPGSLPGCTMNTRVRLLFDRKSDKIIGAHVISGPQAADMVNICAIAIQHGLTADDLANAQYATHPLLTGSPLVYQVMWAAENAVVNRIK